MEWTEIVGKLKATFLIKGLFGPDHCGLRDSLQMQSGSTQSWGKHRHTWASIKVVQGGDVCAHVAVNSTTAWPKGPDCLNSAWVVQAFFRGWGESLWLEQSVLASP